MAQLGGPIAQRGGTSRLAELLVSTCHACDALREVPARAGEHWPFGRERLELLGRPIEERLRLHATAKLEQDLSQCAPVLSEDPADSGEIRHVLGQPLIVRDRLAV